MGKLHGMRCWTCGKKKVIGRQISHSGVRTARIFKPNLHWKKVKIDGQDVRMRLCTKCIKRLKRQVSLASAEATAGKQIPEVTKATD